MRLSGHTALVTGAGRNLGKAIALELAREGADIVVGTRSNVEEAAEVCREIESLGRRSVSVQADVGNPGEVQRAVETAQSSLGTIDILISNAVERQHKDYIETTDEEWRRMFEVVVNGAFYLTRALIPGMMERGWGRVVFISGYGAFDHHSVSLSAAKMALVGMCESLARGYGKNGILLNTISPGIFATSREPGSPSVTTPERLERIPVRKAGEPHEIAKLCALLSSDDNGFITGENILMNGGEHMRP
jgi:3-oxoacyl-[acyl-carrier protein] reductase